MAAFAAMCMTVALLSVPTCRLFAGVIMAIMLPSTVTGLFLAMVVPVIFSVIATRGFVAVVVAVMITFLGCRLAVRTSLQF